MSTLCLTCILRARFHCQRSSVDVIDDDNVSASLRRQVYLRRKRGSHKTIAMLQQFKTIRRRVTRMFSGHRTPEKQQQQVLSCTTPRKKLRDTAYLDGLKASAAFMVYIHHMTMRYYVSLGDWYGRGPHAYQLIRLPFLRYDCQPLCALLQQHM